MRSGQNQLLNAALASRRRAAEEVALKRARAVQAAEEQHEQDDPKLEEILTTLEPEADEPLAGPIDLSEDQPPAAPITEVPVLAPPVEKKFSGSLLDYPELVADLRNRFSKVQTGENVIVVTNALSPGSDDVIVADTAELVASHHVEADVVAGARDGRYRIVPL